MSSALVSTLHRIGQNEAVCRIGLLWIEATYSKRKRIYFRAARQQLPMHVFVACCGRLLSCAQLVPEGTGLVMSSAMRVEVCPVEGNLPLSSGGTASSRFYQATAGFPQAALGAGSAGCCSCQRVAC